MQSDTLKAYYAARAERERTVALEVTDVATRLRHVEKADLYEWLSTGHPGPRNRASQP